MDDAVLLIANNVRYYVEGANMPATTEALKLLRLSPKILTAGAKASGSGGGFRYLLERRDIVPGDQVIPQPVLLRRGGGGIVDAAHNGPQLLVHLPPGPAVADGVLGHLQGGHGHAAGAGGLGARQPFLKLYHKTAFARFSCNSAIAIESYFDS